MPEFLLTLLVAGNPVLIKFLKSHGQMPGLFFSTNVAANLLSRQCHLLQVEFPHFLP